METVLKGLPMVVAYLDDILVAGRTEQEHLTNLAQVLERLNSAGMKLKKTIVCFLFASGRVSGTRHSRRRATSII